MTSPGAAKGGERLAELEALVSARKQGGQREAGSDEPPRHARDGALITTSNRVGRRSEYNTETAQFISVNIEWVY